MRNASFYLNKLSSALLILMLSFINIIDALAMEQKQDIAELYNSMPNVSASVDDTQNTTQKNHWITIRTAFLYDETYRPVLQIICDNDDLNTAVFAHQDYAYFIFSANENAQKDAIRFRIINKSPNLIQLPNVKGGVILRAAIAPQTLARLTFLSAAADMSSKADANARTLTTAPSTQPNAGRDKDAAERSFSSVHAIKTLRARAFEQTSAPHTYDFTFSNATEETRIHKNPERDLVGALGLQNHAVVLKTDKISLGNESGTRKAQSLSENAIYFTDPNTSEKFAVFASSLPPSFIGRTITSPEFDLLQTQTGVVINYRTHSLNVKSKAQTSEIGAASLQLVISPQNPSSVAFISSELASQINALKAKEEAFKTDLLNAAKTTPATATNAYQRQRENYAKALIALQDNEDERAQKLLLLAASGPLSIYQNLSLIKLTFLNWEQQNIEPEAAAHEIEKLRFLLRNTEYETQVLQELSTLYEKSKNTAKLIKTYRELFALTQDAKLILKIRRAFEQALATNKQHNIENKLQVSKQHILLYYTFPELMPTGEKSLAIKQHLIDDFVNLGLLKQAYQLALKTATEQTNTEQQFYLFQACRIARQMKDETRERAVLRLYNAAPAQEAEWLTRLSW